ncbi:hypothetical protein T492DRAFT_388342 [Pavlovales sp. CCMP2436]|nr:hypothetical protein T492DRAFT_388342 [Pavlovales sp. CCMP2436]
MNSRRCASIYLSIYRSIDRSIYLSMCLSGSTDLHRCVCKYLEIRPSPDRSQPDPSVEKHSDQGTLAEHTDTVPTTEAGALPHMPHMTTKPHQAAHTARASHTARTLQASPSSTSSCLLPACSPTCLRPTACSPADQASVPLHLLRVYIYKNVRLRKRSSRLPVVQQQHY